LASARQKKLFGWQPRPHSNQQLKPPNMKTKTSILALLLTACFALAHGGVELGPNGGRLLEFSKDESLHGEVTVKDGKFHIALLDKALKPVALAAQELTATGGDRNKPTKLSVEKSGDHFIVPLVKEGDWIIFQFKETAKGKAITARMQYDTATCSKCKAPEWVCRCDLEKGKK
jgi:hypothetical protein